MTEERTLLRQTAAEMIHAHCAPHEMPLDVTWQPALWADLEATGFSSIGIPEDRGGAGGDLASAADVLRELSKATASVPFAESTLLAKWILALGDAAVPAGPLTIGVVETPDEVEVARVPYAAVADALVLVLAEDEVRCAVIDRGAWTFTPGSNLADEPRDAVSLIEPVAEWQEVRLTLSGFRRRCGLVRSIAISGALEGALESSVRYAREREQFGRSIATFQSVQEMLAALAGETASVRAAVEAAIALTGTPAEAFGVAAAKTRASEAAGIACQLAHQIHGAMGYTNEHVLGRITRRLWSWRDEDGNERVWAYGLGEMITEADEDIWAGITAATAG